MRCVVLQSVDSSQLSCIQKKELSFLAQNYLCSQVGLSLFLYLHQFCYL